MVLSDGTWPDRMNPQPGDAATVTRATSGCCVAHSTKPIETACAVESPTTTILAGRLGAGTATGTIGFAAEPTSVDRGEAPSFGPDVDVDVEPLGPVETGEPVETGDERSVDPDAAPPTGAAGEGIEGVEGGAASASSASVPSTGAMAAAVRSTAVVTVGSTMTTTPTATAAVAATAPNSGRSGGGDHARTGRSTSRADTVASANVAYIRTANSATPPMPRRDSDSAANNGQWYRYSP